MTMIQGQRDFFWGSNWPTRQVDVTALDPITRIWKTEYLSFTVDFEIQLLCGQASVPYTVSGIGCGGPGINWVEDETLGTYDPQNDHLFTINIIENVENGCGAGVSPGGIFEMRKVN